MEMPDQQPMQEQAAEQGSTQKSKVFNLPTSLLEQFSPHDIDAASKVLEAVGRLDVDEYRNSSGLRPLRKAVASVLKLQQKTMFEGKNADAYFEERVNKRSLKRQKTTEKSLQQQYIEKTALRQGRVEKLRAKQSDAADEENEKIQRALTFMIPDGHVDVETSDKVSLLLENGEAAADPAVKLPCHRSCYVCKIRYRDLHHFYDQLCPVCAALNWTKRKQTCDLSSKVAVVTGSRVKIGFQVTLKLLRAGCTVVATTRFPNASVEAYRKEPDFASFQDRLLVYGLDLRDVPGLEAFVRFLKQRFQTTGIDILINNACQTIRRPAGYYRPLVEKEQTIWAAADDTHRQVLADCLEFERVRRRIALDQKQGERQHVLPAPSGAHESQSNQATADGSSLVVRKPPADAKATPFETNGISHSAAMSQMIILPEDVGVDNDILPPGVSDINGHQLDLRKTNSWLLKMEEVTTPELMECMFVNAIAPFVLNSRLKPLMSSIPQERPDRYIVNVSAMEGKFYRYKTACHPHTNMAKAALNMLTRTSAEDLAKNHRIFMNSVDTGWINDENPLEKASQIAKNNRFQTPIDEIDAAARIVDPIFTGVMTKQQVYGKFLKDYKETEW